MVAGGYRLETRSRPTHREIYDRATYDEELAGLEEAMTFTHLELRDAALEDFDMEASLGYARAVITKTYQLWESSNPDQKRRLQKLIFPQASPSTERHLEHHELP